jgi:hypothetical protein
MKTYPLWAFYRHHDIELEDRLLLAGTLFVDRPKEEVREDFELIKANIIDLFCFEARSGELEKNAAIFGWADGVGLASAVDVNNQELMAQWEKRCVSIAVRVDGRLSAAEFIKTGLSRAAAFIREEEK